MKPASVQVSHQEGGHSTEGTSCLLEDQRYTHCTLCTADIPVSSLWHGRLGHLSKAGIMHLSRAGYIPKLSFSDHQFCEHRQYGKQVAASHPTSAPRNSSLLDLVHSDVFGPMPHQSLGGASYFVSFIDDSTRKVWAYPIRTKDRVFSIFSD